MQHADLIRRLLLTGEMLTEPDAAQLEKTEGTKR